MVKDGVQRIVLVTSNNGVSTSEIENAADSLANTELKHALRLEVRGNSAFARNAHDRFVLLQAGNVGCTFSIGKGIEVFESLQASQEFSFSSSDGPIVGRLLGTLGVDASPHFV